MPPRRINKKILTRLPTKSTNTDIEAKLSGELAAPDKPTPKNPPKFPEDPKNDNVRYWLIKSEPYSRFDPKTGADARFSLADLQKVDQEEWNGVRNHEAKNNMLNMKKGDILLFYHSNAQVPGIVGLAKVANEAHPDTLQFNSKSSYYDSKSTKQNPRWWCIDATFLRRFRAKIPLNDLRDNPSLAEMVLVKRGRLSVTPVRQEEYYEILEMERKKPITDDIDCDIDQKYIDVEIQ